MHVSFNELPQSARVWIYQTNRTLTIGEKEIVSDYLKKNTDQWAAHGAPLKSSFTITENRFVIISADEAFNAASGCSIDASTHWLKDLGSQLNVNFFDRALIYKSENGELKEANPFGVKKLIENGEVLPKTPLYTQQVNNLGALENWPVTAESQIQYKRFFKKENADA
jgi:hypothetical protein